MERFHIPMVVWAPGLVEPARVDALASQIDVAPTLLGLLDLRYVSEFFGRDVLHDSDVPASLFMANYQTVGYIGAGEQVELRPKRATKVIALDGGQQQRGPRARRARGRHRLLPGGGGAFLGPPRRIPTGCTLKAHSRIAASPPEKPAMSTATSNPLLQPWDTPSVCRRSSIRAEHFRAGLRGRALRIRRARRHRGAARNAQLREHHRRARPQRAVLLAHRGRVPQPRRERHLASAAAGRARARAAAGGAPECDLHAPRPVRAHRRAARAATNSA